MWAPFGIPFQALFLRPATPGTNERDIVTVDRDLIHLPRAHGVRAVWYRPWPGYAHSLATA